MQSHHGPSPIRIAVLGAGHLGRIHAKLLAQNTRVQLVAVADPVDAARAMVRDQLHIPTVESYRELDGKVDAVVIAAPTFLHFELGQWCLERGIHTLIEKPICADCDDAQQLIATAHDRGSVLQIGHVERFNPIWSCLQSNLHGDDVQYIEAVREGTYTGRSTDIGIVMDLMIHDLDLILSYVSSEVVEIDAYGRHVLGEHEDFAVANLRFRNGCMAHLTASRVSSIARRQMQLHSEHTVASVDFATGSMKLTRTHEDVACGERRADTLPAELRFKVKDELFTNWLHSTEHKADAVNAIEQEHLDFVRAIATQARPRVDGNDGFHALRIAAAIVEKIESRRLHPSIIPAADRFGSQRRKAS